MIYAIILANPLPISDKRDGNYSLKWDYNFFRGKKVINIYLLNKGPAFETI